MADDTEPVTVRVSEKAAYARSSTRGTTDGADQANRSAEGPLFATVTNPVESLDLEDLGLEVKVSKAHLDAILQRRVELVTQVYDTIDRVTKDLSAFRPKVPAALPTSIVARLANPDGSPAAGVRVRALAPTEEVETADRKFEVVGWTNPESLTDDRGAFRLSLPSRPIPEAGLTLAIIGGNRIVEKVLRRVDLVAGNGVLGVLPLDSQVSPLPRSILAQLRAAVLPTGPADVADNPSQFAAPAPTITLGSGDCATSFQSNSGAIDQFGYSMLVRLIAPELSARRLASRVQSANRGSYLLSASSLGISKYVPVGDLVKAMGELGSWEIASRVPVESPIDITAFLDAIERNPKSVPKAASLGLGYTVKMHQLWIPTGLSLGDLVYSLPLAPGEQQRIAISDERESLSIRDQESMTAEEHQRYNENANSSTNAVFSSAYNEAAAGGSQMKTNTESGSFGGAAGIGGFFGGIVAGIGIAGGYADSTTTGSSSSCQNASRDYVSNASQDFHSNLARAASARRTASRTSVRLASSTEQRSVVTKVITNHNHNHALTMQYWQVLRHFGVTSTVDDVQMVCFVPFEVIQFLPSDVPRTLPTGTYSRNTLLYRYGQLLRHHDVLRGRLWRQPALAHGLSLLMSFAGDPTMTAEGSSGAAEDIVNLSLTGSFLPCEDVWVTAVSTTGARVGPVRMTGASASIAAGAETKAALLQRLRDRRVNTFDTKTAALAQPNYIARSNLARFEFSRAFRQLSYRLTMPSNLSFVDAIAYLSNSTKLDVTMEPEELEREISGPTVSDPTAKIGGAVDIIEAYNSIGGSDTMPALLPVAAKRLPPVMSFADLLRIEALLQHVVQNTVEYSKAVWQSLTAEERAILLERFTIGVPNGGLSDASDEVPLLNCVANQVLGYFGNAAIMPFFIPPPLADKIGYTSRDVQETLLRFHRQFYAPARSSITLPAKGVLGEAVLGHCESSEKIDLTRFWNWQDSPADVASDPATLAGLLNGGTNQLVGPAGAQAPSSLNSGSMVTINQGPAAFSPADLASALIKSQPASGLPADLTGITQLGAQMKVQTETTADSLNKTIAEASGLAKAAMASIPEAIKAKKTDDAAAKKGDKSTGPGGATGGTTPGGTTPGGTTPAGTVDGGAAPTP